MKFTWDNILFLLLMLFIIIFPFWQGTESTYGKIWEDVSVVATIIYALLLYISGFFFKKFTGLKDWQKGLIGIFIFIITLFSLPFIYGFFEVIFPNITNFDYLNKLYGDINYSRSLKMLLLFLISLLFTIIDFIMLKKAVDSKINYATNLYVSDIPVTITFLILLLYALHIGDETIKREYLNHFYEGAIAFQMIFSNIIWMYNDDEFWKSIITKKNK